MHRTTRAALALVTVSVGLSYLSQRPTQAYPRFMKKEGLTSCGYCHVKEEGKGARNYRGNFYEEHANSFAGFDDAAEAKKAGADIAPHADQKPASLTAPVAAPAATPAPAKPAATPAPTHAPVATENAYTAASARAHSAMLASQKSPKDAKLKAAYVTALAAYTHATLTNKELPAAKRKADTMTLAKRVLALDPKNASAKADMKAASGM